MRCLTCHSEILPEALFCHRCGESVPIDARGEQSVNVEALSLVAFPQQHERNLMRDAAPRQEPIDDAAGAKDDPVAASTSSDDVLWRGAFSVKAMVPSALFCCCLTFLGGLLVWRFLPHNAAVFAVAASAAGLLWLYEIIDFASQRAAARFTVTDRLLCVETGFLRRRRMCMELYHVESISIEQTLLDRLSGVGSLAFRFRGGRRSIMWRGVDRPTEVVALIDELRRNAAVRDSKRKTSASTR